MSWTTPPTWTAGQTAGVAAGLQILSDDLAVIGGAWSTYTPIWTGASSNPAILNGTITGRYLQTNKTVDFLIVITMGSTTTYGSGQWQLTLPASPLTTARLVFGDVDLYDTSASAGYTGQAVWKNSSSVIALASLGPVAGGPNGSVLNTYPFTWASGDSVTIRGRYEAA